jgi:hypothetical protein
MVRFLTTISTMDRVSPESVCHDLSWRDPEIPTWEPLARYFPTVSDRFFHAMQETHPARHRSCDPSLKQEGYLGILSAKIMKVRE